MNILQSLDFWPRVFRDMWNRGIDADQMCYSNIRERENYDIWIYVTVVAYLCFSILYCWLPIFLHLKLSNVCLNLLFPMYSNGTCIAGCLSAMKSQQVDVLRVVFSLFNLNFLNSLINYLFWKALIFVNQERIPSAFLRASENPTNLQIFARKTEQKKYNRWEKFSSFLILCLCLIFTGITT